MFNLVIVELDEGDAEGDGGGEEEASPYAGERSVLPGEEDTNPGCVRAINHGVFFLFLWGFR